MSTAHQLHFRVLPPEAQHAALQRLALHGWDPASISAQTGVPEKVVRRHLADAALAPLTGLPLRRRRVLGRPDARSISMDS